MQPANRIFRTARAVAAAAIASAALIALTPLAFARPLVTEEVPTVGRFNFEANFGLSHRTDKFGTPNSTYQTTRIPVRFRLGLAAPVEIGLEFQHINHTLKSGGYEYSGSRCGLFSPEIKYVPFKYAGVRAIWHKALAERSGQSLPIGRGDDVELMALGMLPTPWPFTVNVGYLFRQAYNTNAGVSGALPLTIHPGNIFEAKGALEVPLPKHLSIVPEILYYRVDTRKIGANEVVNSAGDAADAYVSLGWANAGWNIRAGAGWGLLKEGHTSFDLERGAGDANYLLSIAYRLAPRKPGS